MDYNLDNKVKLAKESEYPSLYAWSLQEFENNGKKIGADHVPWAWSIYFDASNLKSHFTNEINQDFSESDKQDVAVGSTNSSEIITASLRPQSKGLIAYSMFGTQRKVNNFALSIHKLADGKTEQSMVWGSVSYNHEWDFQDLTEEDSIGFELQLSPEKFNKILNLINLSNANKLVVRLSRVHGFYSPWSPSIRTHQIKILANINDQKVEIPEDCKVNPPVLGFIGEFYISISQNHQLVSMVSEDGKETEYQNSNEAEDDETKDVSTNENILLRLQRLEQQFIKLLVPLWIIVAILAYGLIA